MLLHSRYLNSGSWRIAKSLDGALAVQQRVAQETYKGFVDQMNKFNELYAAAAKEAYRPFEAQIAQFTNRVGGPK